VSPRRRPGRARRATTPAETAEPAPPGHAADRPTTAADSPGEPAPPGDAADPPASLYDRYRTALRVGHLAALRGNREMASRAYLEAAALLPDRAAPYVGLGKAELGAERPAEALSAYGFALQRSPSDTAALDGAARALIALDRRTEAADMLDRLAITLLEHDRQPDALATIERALDLAASRWRRSAHDRLRAETGASDSSWLGDLPAGDRERIATAQVADLPRHGGAPGPIPEALRTLAERVERASAANDVAGLLDGAMALAQADRLRAAIDACHDALSVAPADPAVHQTLAAVYRQRGWSNAARHKLRLVDRLLEIVDDPEELDRLAERAETDGDIAGLLAVVERHAERGRRATALDLAFRALSLAPDDVRVHLAIARLHLALGWRRRAVDEVNRLARLIELTGDDEGRRLVASFVNVDLAGIGRGAIAAS
jgi:tetratricopeptide (TPR) repeat protein